MPSSSRLISEDAGGDRSVSWFEWSAFFCITIGIVICCALATGCERVPTKAQTDPTPVATVDGQRIPIGDGTELEYHQVTTGSSEGSSLTTSAADQAANFKTTAPSLTLPGAAGDGGNADTSFSLKGIKFLDGTSLFGLLFFAAAGYCLYRTPPQVRAAVMCAAAGAAVFLIPSLPWEVWACVLAAGVVYLWVEHKASDQKPKHEALRAALAAINDLPEAARDQFNRLLQSHAEAGDATVINQVRKADDLRTV